MASVKAQYIVAAVPRMCDFYDVRLLRTNARHPASVQIDDDEPEVFTMQPNGNTHKRASFTRPNDVDNIYYNAIARASLMPIIKQHATHLPVC